MTDTAAAPTTEPPRPDRDRNGRFLKGRPRSPGSGIKKGQRWRSTELAERLIDGRLEEVVAAALAIATDKDHRSAALAQRTLLERILPQARDRPMSITLPHYDGQNLHEVANAVLQSIAAGEIGATEGQKLLDIVTAIRREEREEQLVGRLERLERQVTGKSRTNRSLIDVTPGEEG